jgi:hypothetical protein
MLAYPDSTGSQATAPHRVLQMVRENLDYLDASSVQSPVTTRARHGQVRGRDSVERE